MQEVMAELQQLGALDPASQERLMADLRQTDPVHWPMVVQQFRAAVEYHRRSLQRQQEGVDRPRTSAVRAASGTIPPQSQADARRGQPPPTGRAWPTRTSEQIEQGPEPLGRLPATDDAAQAPPEPPPRDYPATPHPHPGPDLANHPIDVRQAPRPGRHQDNSTDNRAGQAQWQAHLRRAIQALETQLHGPPSTPDEIAKHAQLRMLYVLAGRREDAVKPIPSIPAAHQEFWSKQLYGLATWLDADSTADPARRTAETKRILQEALIRLGESAPLVVRNLAFCTEVQSYGCTKPFKSYKFAPGQEVLLYAEVENFISEPTAKGFHTSLRSSYQIFDSRGQRVADHRFATTEEHCQNARRDFFIGYRLRLPSRIYPGKHTLQLTIEDLKDHKVGQSSIDFTIRGVEK